MLSETVSVAAASSVPDAQEEVHVDPEVDVASALDATLVEEQGENGTLENEGQTSDGAIPPATASQAEPAPGPSPGYPDDEISRGSAEPSPSSAQPNVRSIDPNAAFVRMRDARESMDRQLASDRHLAWLQSRVLAWLAEIRADRSPAIDTECVARTHAHSVSLDCENAELTRAFETRPAELDVFLGRLVAKAGGPGGLRIAFPLDRFPLLSPAP